MKQIGLLCATAIFAVGCIAVKPYKSPDTASVVDSLYRTLELGVDTSFNEADVSWRDFFTDTTLVNYIEECLSANFDLQISLRNIAKAEAQLKQGKAAYSPSLSASGGYGGRLTFGQGEPTAFNHVDQWGANLSWELDLWGKITSAKRSAQASLWAEEEVHRGLQSTLVARIATLYYTLVAYDTEVEVINRTIVNRRAYLKTTRELKRSAKSNEVAVQQAIAQLAQAEAALSQMELAIIKTENAFRALLARPSGAVARDKVIDITDAKLVEGIGVPAHLLSNRPDVRAAENNYRAAHEMWNVSRAAMYPSLSISASGVATALFSGHFGTLDLLAGLTAPIWNGRKLRTQKELADLTAQQSRIRFYQTVLLAGQEVSDALATQLKTREMALAQVVQLRSSRLSYDYSMELFVNGYATYLDVLVAQTNVFNIELALVETYLQNLSARIELYRALGGGGGA